MKRKIIIISCLVLICVLAGVGAIFLSGDWEQISQSIGYYYPEEIFYDLNGTSVENTGYFSYGMDFEPAEYNAVKVKCDVMIETGGIEYVALKDENENVIKEWSAPATGFEEELNRDIFEKMAFDTQQGKKGTEGQVIFTIYGKPKLITLIKRKITYLINM